MILVRFPDDVFGVRFPHTSGDDPRWGAMRTDWIEFSPHKWGWSYMYRSNLQTSLVFPTQVGMIHTVQAIHVTHFRFPHTSGDDPFRSTKSNKKRRFSPHKWGWSFYKASEEERASVFPTQVGMIPSNVISQFLCPSFPHTSGDDPMIRIMLTGNTWFSPHKCICVHLSSKRKSDQFRGTFTFWISAKIW